MNKTHSHDTATRALNVGGGEILFEGGPSDLPSEIAAKIMCLNWTRGDTDDEHANRYGQLQEIIEASLPLAAPDGTRIEGPYGWLVKPIGLAEDEWSLESDPAGDDEHAVSVPLYALEPQKLGVTSKSADWLRESLQDCANSLSSRPEELRGPYTLTPGPNPSPAAKGGEAVREAVNWSETTLLRYCNEAQAGRYPSDPREFERRVDAAFRTIRAALATPSPQPANAVREALAPFAKLAADSEWNDVPDKHVADVVYRSMAGGEETIGTVTFGELRSTRAALASDPAPAGEAVEPDDLTAAYMAGVERGREDTARLREDLERAAKDLRTQTLREGALRERDDLFERASKDRMVGATVAAQWLRSHGAMSHKERATSTPLNIVEAALLAGERDDARKVLERVTATVQRLYEENCRENGVYDPSTNATEFSGEAEDMDILLQQILEELQVPSAARSASREGASDE